jgi:hypothetical protein
MYQALQRLLSSLRSAHYRSLTGLLLRQRLALFLLHTVIAIVGLMTRPLAWLSERFNASEQANGKAARRLTGGQRSIPLRPADPANRHNR